jgi:carbamate kinase
VRKTAVYALGGNALQSPGGGSNDAAEVLARVMSDVIDLLEMDWSVVLTHGNGPQVGHLLAMDREQSHPLDAWVAATQGMIGHELSMHLQAILERRRRPERTAVILTRVEVDSEDDGFHWPTKPVGPVLAADTVMTADWDIAQTVHGPRRVVASPKPLHIIDLDVIKRLVELNAVVICGGGGGVPTARLNQHLQGMPAVIDKDLFSSLLARELEAHALIISTESGAIYRGFGTDNAEALSTLTVAEARSMEEAGEFPPGSMAPKVNALCEFSQHSDAAKALLCAPGDVLLALRGERGTNITRS